ncbi:MAG: GNAT family N-acetyltransferase, partial [Acidimicrobiales bacterium]
RARRCLDRSPRRRPCREHRRRRGPSRPPTSADGGRRDAVGTCRRGDRDSGELVATANVRREDPPAGLREDVAPDSTAAPWRLRGMATREDLRGRGIGALVLEACVRHVGAQGGGFLWCNARVPARRFYARGGFAEWGEEFESFDVTHVVMWRLVEAEGSGQ